MSSRILGKIRVSLCAIYNCSNEFVTVTVHDVGCIAIQADHDRVLYAEINVITPSRKRKRETPRGVREDPSVSSRTFSAGAQPVRRKATTTTTTITRPRVSYRSVTGDQPGAAGQSADRPFVSANGRNFQEAALRRAKSSRDLAACRVCVRRALSSSGRRSSSVRSQCQECR